MQTTEKANRYILGAGIALQIPPAWNVFQGLRTLADFPTPIALFAIAGMGAIAVGLIFQGLRVLEAGDVKDARLIFAVSAAVMIAEFAGQWWFAITESHALVTALVLSILSVGGMILLESEIMRVWKANGRRSGQITLARAQCPPEVRKLFPDVADIFTRNAVRFPTATQESLLADAFAEHDRRAVEAESIIRVSVSDLRAAGQNPDSAALSGGQPAIGSGPADDPRTVSELVKAAIADIGPDEKAVRAAVAAQKSGANPDTIRKTVQKELRLRSA